MDKLSLIASCWANSCFVSLISPFRPFLVWRATSESWLGFPMNLKTDQISTSNSYWRDILGYPRNFYCVIIKPFKKQGFSKTSKTAYSWPMNLISRTFYLKQIPYLWISSLLASEKNRILIRFSSERAIVFPREFIQDTLWISSLYILEIFPWSTWTALLVRNSIRVYWVSKESKMRSFFSCSLYLPKF